MENAEKLIRAQIDRIIPNITKGLGKQRDHCDYKLSVPNGSFFMSSLFMLTIRYGDDKEETVKLVLKLPAACEDIRNITSQDRQFHNEIIFYEEFAKDSSDFPKCVASKASPSEYFIVLEDLSVKGYSLCPQKYNCPLEFVLCTMHEIGRFHAKGYTMKQNNQDKFLKMVSKFKECRYEHLNTEQFRFDTFLNLITPRAVRFLRSRGYDTNFCDKMEMFLSNTFENVMLKSVKPVEPLATLCHGDLTANNILFKRDDSNNLKAILLDFALVRYSSPAIDLTTFLCLCCSNELRRAKFSDIFHCYYDSLKECLQESGIQDFEKYSFDNLLKDYKERILFGFVIATFYLPILMGYGTVPVEDIMKLTIEENVKISSTFGGDKMSEILAQMLLEFRDYGCLDYILQQD
ncbi:uncharacterized protein [Prorops nasuta]|uniref:uncharacterized protein n=1 Tax=Prorops nasuta TaxID=863751 RepID=UPI0034CE94DA